MVEGAPLPVRPFMALVSSHTPRGCPWTGNRAGHISHIHNSSFPSSLLPSLAPILPQVAPIDWAKYKNNIEAPGFVDFLKERYEGIDWSQLNTKLNEEEIAADAAGKAALVRYRAFPTFALRVCVLLLLGGGRVEGKKDVQEWGGVVWLVLIQLCPCSYRASMSWSFLGF